MSIDNADIAIDTSSLAANIEIIVYQEVNGKIQYNDRPSVRDAFTDPSPYQPFINLWLTAYSTATPPLTLAQAKFVKCDFVEGIFHSKRRAPFSSGGHIYDGNDEAVQYLTATLSGGVYDSTGGLVSAINAAFSSQTSSINSGIIDVSNINANANNISAGNINSWSNNHHQNWLHTSLSTNAATANLVYMNAQPIGGGSTTGASGSGPGYGGFQGFAGFSGLTPPTVAGGGGGSGGGPAGTSPWQPLDAA